MSLTVETGGSPPRAWRRALTVPLAVGLEVLAALGLMSQHLVTALAGVVLAGAGWLLMDRAAASRPARRETP
jgi:hypothetical protein